MTKTNLRDLIICLIIWGACAIALGFVFVQTELKIAAAAFFPIVFFTDLVIWIGYSLARLPCGFTEWVCYPFWPFKYRGFPMRWGVVIRLVEIVTLLVSGHWLFETVKSLL